MSKRGQRFGCPLTNPRGLQSEQCRVRESSTLVPQRGYPLLTTVPHGASGGKGAKKQRSPLDPGLVPGTYSTPRYAWITRGQF